MRKYKQWIRILFFLAALAEIGTLFVMRHDFYAVREEGTEYVTPAAVNFQRNFYESAYVSLHVPVDKARWIGENQPVLGERIYLAVTKDKEGRLQVLNGQLEKPSGEYITVRSKGVEGDVVHFDFPTDRLYMNAEELRRLPISELAERVQVRDADTGRVVSRMKNSITAAFRVKDGRVVITGLMVNGSPIQNTYTTVGTNVYIKYASSEKEKDQIIPAGAEETAGGE